MLTPKHIKSALTLLGCVFGLCAKAAPYDPTPYTVDNKGEEITIQHIGDEHYSYYQTTDGYLVDKDANGTYYYLNNDGQTSSVKVSNQHTTKELEFLLSLNANSIKQIHKQKHPAKHVRPYNEENRPKVWVSGKTANNTNSLKRMPSGNNCMGTDVRFPVILVAGTGKSNCSSADMSDMLNKEGYSKNNHNGSVKDYFKSASNGQFIPTFDVYSVSVNKQLVSYNDNEGQLVVDVVNQLNSNPDFNARLYDADNDGEIDAFAILYAGTEAESDYLGGYQYAMMWEAEGMQRLGSKKVNEYLILPQMENRYKLAPICSFVHEFSHAMGLKDHYSVRNHPETFTTQYPGAHAWDVMSTGMYNNGGGCPPGYSAYEKDFMGWINPTSLTTTDGTTAIKPLITTQDAYKIVVSENECFYIENRQKIDWDASLPNHGMLIWHIDFDQRAWNNDEMNDDEAHQRVDLVEAGNMPVISYYDGFEKDHLIDDPFPGSQNVTSFNRFKSWTGKDLGISLYHITEKDYNIFFTTKEDVEVNTYIKPDSAFYSFKYEVKLPLSDNYQPATVDISEVLEKLDISNKADSLYEIGALKIFGINPDETRIDQMTAIAPGHWFNKNGEVSSYDEGYVYAEYTLKDQIARIGHYPNKVKVGEHYYAWQGFKIGKFVAYISYIITIADTTNAGVTNEHQTRQAILADNKLKLSSLAHGQKHLKVFDIAGQLLYTESFEESEKTIEFDKTGNNRVVIVTVEGDKQEKITCKGVIK